MEILNKHFKDKFNKFLTSEVSSNVNSYYVFASRYTPWDDENNPPETTNDEKNSYYDIQNEMLFGKKILDENISIMVNKNEWTANTKYDQYDDEKDLSDLNYFIINSEKRVYKCLKNANTNSLYEPTSISNDVIELADGYLWKYMYTIDETSYSNFTTETMIPVIEDANVISSAIDGAIYNINIENPGQFFTTYSEGTILEVKTEKLFRVSSNNSYETDFFNECSMYITAGNTAGSLEKIKYYTANSSGNWIELYNDVSGIDILSTYIISPTVVLEGDGQNFQAYSLIDLETEEISDIIIINPGSGYHYANVSLLHNENYGKNSELRPIISPIGGHGSNIPVELNSSSTGLSISFNGTEEGYFTEGLKYRKIGIISNIEDSNGIYEDNFYNATTSVAITDTISTFNSLEMVEGLTSGAKAKVISSNTSNIIFGYIDGEFQVAEKIIGKETSSTATISTINNSDIISYTGNIIYYQNIPAIEKKSANIESIKLVINF